MGLFGSLFGGGGGLTAEQAKAEMDSGKDYTLIDVRNPDEYKMGHIPGAKLMPLSSLQASAGKGLPDKGARILVYCQSGGRAGSAVQLLHQLGYDNAISFGGISSWPYEVV
ncbi:MAG: rhodanese-like domain-containing protein [Coriobacteriia bacterium]|nr:rhodanese-like domain-containing protein [Coriobacteriia bacterium]